ncbi:MAG: hypothetical protein MZV64_16615 [Ignavibacteriales bacterium]|nr:hypothetical protein [Ignavibacteriales bacterium]
MQALPTIQNTGHGGLVSMMQPVIFARFSLLLLLVGLRRTGGSPCRGRGTTSSPCSCGRFQTRMLSAWRRTGSSWSSVSTSIGEASRNRSPSPSPEIWNSSGPDGKWPSSFPLN